VPSSRTKRIEPSVWRIIMLPNDVSMRRTR
jgi:hypothetical protein